MKVIFALDIKDGQVVQGIKGEREKYAPPISQLFDVPTLENIVNAVNSQYKINTFYVADLNAITKTGSNEAYLKEVIDRLPDISFYIDPGVFTAEDIKKYLDNGYQKVIVGLETLVDINILNDLYQRFGDQILFSLDSHNERIMTKDNTLEECSISDVIDKVLTFGIKEIILLDTKKVGSYAGYSKEYYKMLLKYQQYINIYVAGGIKSSSDLYELKQLGIKGVILASAIYSGTITKKGLINLKRG